jgi:hypothetical protein
MALRVVAIPLFAAICLASPVISSGEQVKKGRGYSPRAGGSGGETATRSGGDNSRGGDTSRSGGGDRTAATSSRPSERRADNPPAERRAVSRPADERRTESARSDDRDDDRQRYAVRRNNNVVVNNPPRININIGPSYGRHYAPIHYDYWARRYYRWSPIRYAPWSLIYGSIGFPNYGFYGGVGPSPFYYGYNGYGWNYGPGPYSPYGAYPNHGYPHEAGGVRLKIRPRDAQVFVDGHYAGLVDDFDGVFQSLKLEAGGHKIEIRMPGFDALELDIHVQPGRTLTLEEVLQPRP